MQTSNFNFFPLILSLSIIILILSRFYSKPSIRSSKDLTNLNGTITGYSFEEDSRTEGPEKSFILYFKEYLCQFKIGAGFIHEFNQVGFEENFQPGIKYSVSIPSIQMKNINNEDEQVILFSLKNYKYSYLNENISLQNYNNNFWTYVILFFTIIFGLIFTFADRIFKIFSLLKPKNI